MKTRKLLTNLPLSLLLPLNSASRDIDEPTDLLNTDPHLEALTEGSGQFYHPLLPDSPARDGGSNAICSADPVNNVDQLGLSRPVNTTCDIGAIEFETTPEGEETSSQIFLPLVIK